MRSEKKIWWEQFNTFLDTVWPRSSGRTGTAPLSASSSTLVETVVFIGTPSLLYIGYRVQIYYIMWYLTKFYIYWWLQKEEWKIVQKQWPRRKGWSLCHDEHKNDNTGTELPEQSSKHSIKSSQTRQVQLQLLVIRFHSL